MIGNETGHLLKCVELHRGCSLVSIGVKSSTCSKENLDSVKSYDKTNVTVFALSLLINHKWVFTYFIAIVLVCFSVYGKTTSGALLILKQ